MVLEGKKIVLGVCGSIAAYKAAPLTRELVKKGAEVRVVMTTSALGFITPLTLATVSKNPVEHSFVKNEQGEWTNHVELGLWADLLLIAPATANTLAKFANGFCDNLLSAVYLSARCPVFVAPAMDLDMYVHPSVTNNIEKLIEYGNFIIDAEHGELASGLTGKGRLAEPEHIVEAVESFFQKQNGANLNGQLSLKGKKVLITAGPTIEHLDPVRFIGNHSSGKMGFALAERCHEAGAEVIIISGPVHLKTKYPEIQIIKVQSGDEMYSATLNHFKSSNINIFAAAVADYKPANVSDQKIKKNDTNMVLNLVKNKDIAHEMGQIKSADQFNVGFALETENEEANALKKLHKKQFNMIVLNSLNEDGAGFQHNTNKISILDGNNIEHFELKSKDEVALDIVQSIVKRISITEKI